MISVTAGFPSVMVPVLSSTIVSSFVAVSRASLFLNKTPLSAPFPVPAIIAVGVARPSAHGQAITSTATILIMAGTKSPFAKNHNKKTAMAIMMIEGTKTAATRSASA